jgi:lambda family phage portal protein
MQDTALDRMIAYFSPRAGLKRAQARTAMNMVRSYDGAKTGRRTGGWITSGTSPNTEIAPALNALRNRSRDLRRNNPYAAKILSSLTCNAIGTGITLKLADGQDLFNKWAEGDCDADGRHDFYGLQALVCNTVMESGECLVRLRWRYPQDGLAVPLQMQVLEPDYLASFKTENLANGGWILNGIEFDALGRRAAYWLFPQHPGENGMLAKAIVPRRVVVDDVLHIFEQSRPGQIRGVPRLAPVMLKMRDLDDYEEAELVRKGIEACFAAFVTGDGSGDSLTPVGETETESGSNRRLEHISAGMIHYGTSGESVTFGQPSAVQGYNEFIKTQQHGMAAGARSTYEMATGDLSQVNYSSIRAGTLEFRRDVEQFQWLTFIPQFCTPVVRAFIKAAQMDGKKIKADQTPAWTPPKWDWVDPVKDVAGELLEIAAALKPWQEAVRRRGYDPETVLAQVKEDQDNFKKANISVQIDALALGAAAAANTQGAPA